jgi:hypothetical protein
LAEGTEMRAIRSLSIAGLLVILAIAGVAASVRAAGPAPKPRTLPARPGIACPSTGCVTYDWNVVPSANPNTADNFHWGVTHVSTTDAWAVGSQGSYPLSTLIERYDGRGWHTITSPNAAGGNSRLYAVAAVSSTDVWAVGYSGLYNGCSQPTLIEHWNGSVWSIVSSPDTPDCIDELNGITAISSTDIWAVGRAYNNSAHVHETLILHWNGTTWNIVPSPTPSPSGVEADSTLQGVTAVSDSDVWAVGSFNPYSETFTLTEHWNGSQWSAEPESEYVHQ